MDRSKEMLLRMIERCRKVRKHKPKPVQAHYLQVNKKPAVDFPDEDIMGHKRLTYQESFQVRKALRNLIDKD